MRGLPRSRDAWKAPGGLGLRLSSVSVFRSVHDQVSRSGLGDNHSSVRRRVISRQKLRQIVRRKGSKTSFPLRVFH